MFEDYLGGIVFLVMGIAILCGAIFVTKDLVTAIVGGLFTGAGIFWIFQEIVKKKYR